MSGHLKDVCAMIKPACSMRFIALLAVALMTLATAMAARADFGNETKVFPDTGIPGNVFGIDIAVSGDTAVVGATGDDDNGTDAGAAYIFVRNASTGEWTQQEKLLANDGEAGDGFGVKVAISGDTVLIGAVGDDSNTGSAYVFTRSASSWTQQKKLIAADRGVEDRFGRAVALSGNTAVVGAPLQDSSLGAVYVFERDPGDPTGVWEEQKLLYSDVGFLLQFGDSVDIENDTIVIGASGDDDLGRVSGSAYVFVRNLSGTWERQAKLLAPDGLDGDRFGYSVSVSGDTLATGAHQDQVGSATNAGSVYVFVRSGTAWSYQSKLTANEASVAGDFFGRRVGLDGDTLVVGAPGDDTGGESNSGAAFVFMRSGTAWSQSQKIVPVAALTNDNFGASLGLDGENLVVGAWGDDVDGINAGAFYAFNEVSPTPDIRVTDSILPFDDHSVPFGDVLIGGDPGFAQITVYNEGDAPLQMGVVSMPAPPYYIETDGCSRSLLNSGGSCAVQVRFSPTFEGFVPGTIEIPSDDPDTPTVMVLLSGTGVSSTTPDIAVAPLGRDFGQVEVGLQLCQDFVVSNEGNAPLVIETIVHLSPPPFTSSSTCSELTLNPGQQCDLDICFEPESVGAFANSLDIPSNDPDEPMVNVAVDGEGVLESVAVIEVVPGSITFDPTTVGVERGPEEITIANLGGGDLVVTDIELTGAAPGEFDLNLDGGSEPCGDPNSTTLTLSTGQSCSVWVTFQPTTPGSPTADVLIASNDPDDNPESVTLSGTALEPGANHPPSKPRLISPANGQIIPRTGGWWTKHWYPSLNLRWHPSTDPDGDLVKYDVYLCEDDDPLENCMADPVAYYGEPGTGKVAFASVMPTDGLGLKQAMVPMILAGFLGILITWRKRKRLYGFMLLLLTAALVVSCGADGFDGVEHSVSGLSADTTYYWAVVAKDDQGGETASDTWWFTTQ